MVFFTGDEAKDRDRLGGEILYKTKKGKELLHVSNIWLNISGRIYFCHVGSGSNHFSVSALRLKLKFFKDYSVIRASDSKQEFACFFILS